tara:strand:- start:2239 stop:2925 length:687 start_codon:yes stop_codon:yes gene_type:complete
MSRLVYRIQDLIGFNYTDDALSILTEDEALETACAEVIDALPDSYLLKYAVKPVNLHAGNDDTGFPTSGKRTLRVIRKDAGGTKRVCQEVDIDAFEEMQDTDSIYYPTRHSPVYTFDATSGITYLKILPELTGGAGFANSADVFFISYPSGSDLTPTAGSVDGLPNEVEHAIALKASIYILQTKISDAVQDEEDDEMLNMLQVQLQSLMAMYTAELSRLTQIEPEEKQ